MSRHGNGTGIIGNPLGHWPLTVVLAPGWMSEICITVGTIGSALRAMVHHYTHW